MGLDIRLPIGLLFAVLGAALSVFGLISDKAIYQRSLGINVNLWWGLVMLTFGAFMLVLGRRGRSAVRSADDSAEGRKMEQRESKIESQGRANRRGH